MKLMLPEEAGGLKPEECAERCRRAIVRWTQAMLSGDPFHRPHGTAWNSHEDAICAWKESLDHWEKLK